MEKEPIISLRGLSTFEKNLFLKRHVSDLLKIIGEQKRQLELLKAEKTDSVKVKNLKNEVKTLRDANEAKKAKLEAAGRQKTNEQIILGHIEGELKAVRKKLTQGGEPVKVYEAAIYNITNILKA